MTELSAELTIDLSGALQAVEELSQRVNELQSPIRIATDVTAAERGLNLLQRRKRDLAGAVGIGVTVDDTQLNQVEDAVNGLNGEGVDIPVMADTSPLDELQSLASSIAGDTIDLISSVDDTDLEAFQSQARELDGFVLDIVAAVNDDDLGRAQTLLNQIEGTVVDAIIDVDGGSIDAVASQLRQLQGFIVDTTIEVNDGQIAAAQSSLLDLTAPPPPIALDVDTSQGEASVAELFASFGPAAAAAGAVVGGVLFSAVNASIDNQGAVNATAARLGLTEAESQRVGDAAGALYADAYTGSVTEGLGTIQQLVRFELVDINDALGLEQAGAQVETFSNIWEVETELVLRAINQLDDNSLADGAIDALDGLQSALVASQAPADEFLESVQEYSPFLNAAGLSFDEFANIIVTSGASTIIEVDKIGDSIKEATISIDELDPMQIEELGRLAGISSVEINTLVEALRQGDQGAFADIVTTMQDIESETDRAAFSVQLFRAAGEDAASLINNADFSASFTTTAGAAADAADTLRDGFGVELQQLRNEAALLGAELGGELIPVAREFLEVGQDLVPVISDWIGELDEEEIRAAAEAVAQLGEGAVATVEAITPLVGLATDLIGPLSTLSDFAFGDLPEEAERAGNALDTLGNATSIVTDFLGLSGGFDAAAFAARNASAEFANFSTSLDTAQLSSFNDQVVSATGAVQDFPTELEVSITAFDADTLSAELDALGNQVADFPQEIQVDVTIDADTAEVVTFVDEIGDALNQGVADFDTSNFERFQTTFEEIVQGFRDINATDDLGNFADAIQASGLDAETAAGIYQSLIGDVDALAAGFASAGPTIQDAFTSFEDPDQSLETFLNRQLELQLDYLARQENITLLAESGADNLARAIAGIADGELQAQFAAEAVAALEAGNIDLLEGLQEQIDGTEIAFEQAGRDLAFATILPFNETLADAELFESLDFPSDLEIEIPVDVKAETADAEERLDSVRDGLSSLNDRRLGVDVDATEATNLLARFDSQPDFDVSMRVTPDSTLADERIAALELAVINADLVIDADDTQVNEALAVLDRTQIDAVLEVLTDDRITQQELARLDREQIDALLEILPDDDAIRNYIPPTFTTTLTINPQLAGGGGGTPGGVPFFNGGVIDGDTTFLHRGAVALPNNGIQRAVPGGMPFTRGGRQYVMAENGGEELFMNEKAAFSQQLRLLNMFAGGKLARDLEKHYFGKHAKTLAEQAAPQGNAPRMPQVQPSQPVVNDNRVYNIATPVRDTKQLAREIERLTKMQEKEAAAKR